MRKISLLICFVMLGGCHKKNGVPVVSSLSDTDSKMTVLVMGQSNAANLRTAGYGGFQSIYPQAEFINCAVGGTGLDQWQPGGALYTACVAAVAQVHIDMIIWIQGENEAEGGTCDCGGPASQWSQDFTSIARHFQTDYNNAPIYFGRLGDFADPSPWWGAVRTQQTQTTIGTMVSLDGIAPIPNDRHYTAVGYYEITKRFALAKRAN